MADHARSDDPAVQAQLDRFAQLSPGRDILGLERISALMAALGNPHTRLPPVFHVAGTNGKGSTCTFLRFMLEAAGHRVHVYTSPHLVRFNERIRVAGRLIADDALAPLLAEVLDAAEAHDIAPSFFEATTAAAFLAFARSPADACVIEVGLGGRLDATNVIETPLVCGIAQLGVDHQAFLGDDAVAIAREKAGIAKAGVPLVTMGTQYPPEVQRAIIDVANQASAPVFTKWGAKPGGANNHLVYGEGAEAYFHAPPPAVPGRHQICNAGLAIAMLRRQTKLSINAEALKAGVARAHWPARLQRLSPGPLVRTGQEVWLDGTHNPAAAGPVAAHFNGRAPLHLVCGILANKDAAGILAPFANVATSLTAVAIHDHAHHPPTELARLATALGMRATVADDLCSAVAQYPEKHVLILGSLYLAGEALRLNNEIPN